MYTEAEIFTALLSSSPVLSDRIGIVVVVAVLLIVVYIVLYNRLLRLAVKVEEAGSDIDVALEKR